MSFPFLPLFEKISCNIRAKSLKMALRAISRMMTLCSAPGASMRDRRGMNVTIRAERLDCLGVPTSRRIVISLTWCLIFIDAYRKVRLWSQFEKGFAAELNKCLETGILKSNYRDITNEESIADWIFDNYLFYYL